MKKLFKAFLLVAVVACCAVAVAFAGCGDKTTGTTYEGDYHYSQTHGVNTTVYGIKVKVTVDGDKITKVEKVASDYVEVTTSTTVPGRWEQAQIDNWNNNLGALLKAYEGKTVAEIKALEVKCTDSVPDKKADQSWGDSALCISDATQGSGRVLLAVQNALSKIA